MTTEQILLLMGAGAVAFLLAALLGKVMIPELHKLHFGQTIREEGPAWHQKKQGTPTMGGLIFILSTTVVSTVEVMTPWRVAYTACEYAFGALAALSLVFWVVSKATSKGGKKA